MAVTPVNSEDRLVQAAFADHLERVLGWDSAYAWKRETFGRDGTLGRTGKQEAVLARHLRAALDRLNPDLPGTAIDDAMRALTVYDVSRSAVQHNREFYRLLRTGVPVAYRDEHGRTKSARARAIDFDNAPGSNRFLAVRELELTGRRTPNYNRRGDLVCFVNGLPLVFIELKAVYRNVREGFDNNLSDYMDENVIAHAFHHNAFLVVSNGDKARYGTITSGWDHFAEWKRMDETDAGSLEAQALLNGMLAHDRLLDIVENFILFDESKAGATRKVIARNHQVLGVNRAVDSVRKQEDLKRELPMDRRLQHRTVHLPLESRETEGRRPAPPMVAEDRARYIPEGPVDIVERAHPDLGRLGVFWHTQGSGKSYSMAFFAEKVRRKLDGNFTFLLMTDRNDLDSQIYGTFVGTGIADKRTPRAASGDDLQRLLKENHRYVFSLIHKFNKDVDPSRPYSARDDIIVISDEAHRTQAGRLARNMRSALPNAAFIGFTGTPLFQHDELTRRIFGDYVSRYDFKRSEEDGATVKLVYENRGDKLGVALSDLNERIADKIDDADLDPDQEALLEKLLGKDYEVLTADERLERIADDFVEHCATRWESGKSMLVCIDKITCARMLQLIRLRWSAKAASVRSAADAKRAEALAAVDSEVRTVRDEEAGKLAAQAAWLEETVVGLIISEAQNEVRDFRKWGFDIIPHRDLMKRGFDGADGKRVDVETAFKNPDHPFRVAVVCAMWLTGFDVECLSTLYIDKPMKAHNLMQAIARANRVWPGKDHGLIVDYNGVLKSLREALAQYALGDDGTGGEEIIVPIEERVQALIEAIEATEAHLRRLGFDPGTLIGSSGFGRIKGLKDAVEAVHASDDDRRRFETLAREVFNRFKALLTEPLRVRLRGAARQHRGDLQEAVRAARQCGCHRRAEGVASDRESGDPHRAARRRSGRRREAGPERDRHGEAPRGVREEGSPQGDDPPGHPGDRGGEARRDAGAKSDPHGLPAEVRGDRRRLQPREGPGNCRGDLSAPRRAGGGAGHRTEPRRRGRAQRGGTGPVRHAQERRSREGRPRAREAGEPGSAGVHRGALAGTGSVLGEGTDQGRGASVHPRPDPHEAAHAAIHARRHGDGGGRSLRACLATRCPR